MIKQLTESDIGKTIWYIPAHHKPYPNHWEKGVIYSFDNEAKVAQITYPDRDENKRPYPQDYRDLSFLRYVLRKQS